MNYGPATESKINQVINACKNHSHDSIIALSGVPGTGKSFVGYIAAQRIATDPLLVREVQFHQSFTYEEFVEGIRIGRDGGLSPFPGLFLEWNDMAKNDGEKKYVILIEELTRANISAVFGELLTYIEHRDRHFVSVYSRRPIQVAKNLIFITTFNPNDRSAIELDAALIRRLRIITFPPETGQLKEMLSSKNVDNDLIAKLEKIFIVCKEKHGDQYEALMPFGHGIFSSIDGSEDSLKRLWHERIKHLLYRPLMDPHPFASTIFENYMWK
jgi:5-methylcytosine-specific restriction endonuclease McrBC GTP-binding regulatory subunit McrB